MINIIHLFVLASGVIAYLFSDVNHVSGFYNTFLPFIVLVSFIYGLIVTISLFYRSRNKEKSTNSSAGLLLATLKEHGLSDAQLTDVVVPETQPSSARKNLNSVKSETGSNRPARVEAAKIMAEEAVADEPDPDPVLDQASINQQEWHNPDNWSGPAWIAVYFSKRDSRVWVPARFRLFFRTLNLARTAAVYWLYGLWFTAFAVVYLIISAE